MYNNTEIEKRFSIFLEPIIKGMQRMAYSATAAVVREPGGPFSLERVELDAASRKTRSWCASRRAESAIPTPSSRAALPLPGVFGHEGAGIVVETGRRGEFDPRRGPGHHFLSLVRRLSLLRNAPSRSGCENIPALKFARAPQRREPHRPAERARCQQRLLPAVVLRDRTPSRWSMRWSRCGEAGRRRLLAALPCGVQTGAGAVFNTFEMGPGHSLLVFGVGPVGLSAIMAARAGGRVSPGSRWTSIPRAWNAPWNSALPTALDASRDDVPRRVREWLPRGVSHALESSVTASALKDAIKCLGQGGRVGVFSAPPPGEEFPFSTRDLFERVGSLHGIVQGSAVPGRIPATAHGIAARRPGFPTNG